MCPPQHSVIGSPAAGHLQQEEPASGGSLISDMYIHSQNAAQFQGLCKVPGNETGRALRPLFKYLGPAPYCVPPLSATPLSVPPFHSLFLISYV